MKDAEEIQPLGHTDNQVKNYFTYKKSFLIFGLVILLGILSGYSIAYIGRSTNGGKSNTIKFFGNKKVVETKGVTKKNFKDSATGVLQEGGKDGEGSFHLERPGGESQNVYLTSSTVDLSEYVGQKVTVHGETFAAQKVGWLMDVGLVDPL